jgi:TrmH family RNA methyltransferase
VDVISSRQNAFVRRCRELAGRRDARAGEILIDGRHLLSEALAAGVSISAAAGTAAAWDSADGRALAARLESSGARVYVATSAVLEAASPVKTPSGIVAVARRPSREAPGVFAGAPALVVCAVHVQDPGNVGAIVRAADAAGASGVIAAAGSADPFGWKALRGSMGSAFRVPIAVVADAESACARAREHHLLVLAASPAAGTDLREHDLTRPVMILVGGEGAGLPASAEALADASLRIPMRPPVESLNVAVAAGVILFEAQRQRQSGTHP